MPPRVSLCCTVAHLVNLVTRLLRAAAIGVEGVRFWSLSFKAVILLQQDCWSVSLDRKAKGKVHMLREVLMQGAFCLCRCGAHNGHHGQLSVKQCQLAGLLCSRRVAQHPRQDGLLLLSRGQFLSQL